MSIAQIFAWVYFVLSMCRLFSKFLWMFLASAWEGLESSVPTSTRVTGCVVSDVLCGSPSLDFCYSIWKSKKLLALGRWWICLILVVLYFFVGWDWYITCSEGRFTCKASRIKHLSWSFGWCTVAPGTARRGTVGVCLPLSDKFDPLNLSNTEPWFSHCFDGFLCNESTKTTCCCCCCCCCSLLLFFFMAYAPKFKTYRTKDAKLDRYTQVEIKHGRRGNRNAQTDLFDFLDRLWTDGLVVSTA